MLFRLYAYSWVSVNSDANPCVVESFNFICVMTTFLIHALCEISSHVNFCTTNCQRQRHNRILLGKGTLDTNDKCSRINRENVVGFRENN